MNLDNKNKDQDTESLEGQEDKKKRLYSINASDVKIQGVSRTKPINFPPKFHWEFYSQKSFSACYLKYPQHYQAAFV